MSYNIPEFLKEDVRNNHKHSIRSTFINKKCKNCEHLIVLRVNKKKDRGSGVCYHCSFREKNKRTPLYFSDPVCNNFTTRTSELSRYSGGNKLDRNFEQLKAIHENEQCAVCGTNVAWRKNGCLTCNCGNIRYYIKED